MSFIYNLSARLPQVFPPLTSPATNNSTSQYILFIFYTLIPDPVVQLSIDSSCQTPCSSLPSSSPRASPLPPPSLPPRRPPHHHPPPPLPPQVQRPAPVPPNRTSNHAPSLVLSPHHPALALSRSPQLTIPLPSHVPTLTYSRLQCP